MPRCRRHLPRVPRERIEDEEENGDPEREQDPALRIEPGRLAAALGPLLDRLRVSQQRVFEIAHAGADAAGEVAAPERRQVRVNGAPAAANSLSEWLSVLWLTPAMDRLFAEGASARRRFLDRLVLALEPSHAHHSARYEAAMRARNKLLAEPDGAFVAAVTTYDHWVRDELDGTLRLVALPWALWLLLMTMLRSLVDRLANTGFIDKTFSKSGR